MGSRFPRHLWPSWWWWCCSAKSLQSCPTLCDPIDGSPPGLPIPGILQARTLEWVAISFSNAWKWKVKVKSLSHVRLLATPWTAAHQAPPSMGFPRQEFWSGLPLPSPPVGANQVQIASFISTEEAQGPWKRYLGSLSSLEITTGTASNLTFRTPWLWSSILHCFLIVYPGLCFRAWTFALTPLLPHPVDSSLSLGCHLCRLMAEPALLLPRSPAWIQHSGSWFRPLSVKLGRPWHDWLHLLG